MSLDLRDVSVSGPAFPEPFVRLHLEAALTKRGLLPKATGAEGKRLQAEWDALRRKLAELREQGGALRVANHVLEPLAPRLGYERLVKAEAVETREGLEEGGHRFESVDGSARLRAWAVGLDTDLDAPSRRGRAYRFSPERIAQRVLRARGERAGLLTDGQELRLLLADPARPESHLAIRLDRAGGWRAARSAPDSCRLLLALASPAGLAALPELLEEARLAQTTVTRKLRDQARRAVEGFVQELLDRPENAAALAADADRAALARTLWREGLLLVYRLLFVLKLESSADPARAFAFATSSLWRHTYSPNTALSRLARQVLDDGADTGRFLEDGLRALFRVFSQGLDSRELRVHALGGMLFGRDATPTVDALAWGERAVARLLDQLLWTEGAGGARERVHYGALDVEDLGRVYEALLELEPGIAEGPMCRLRRQKLEVVVPAAQGGPYRALAAPAGAEDAEEEADEDGDGDAEERPRRGRRAAAAAATRVRFVEDIPAGRFFLRVGLGRKASGSYYTPHPFVRFLVQETLGPQVAERSTADDPQPAAILGLRVLDPAMGSGHFLVEACRFLADALYEACRLCDERASEAEAAAEEAEAAGRKGEAAAARERAAALRARVAALPDPEDELVAYLPSRAAEGEHSGLSQRKAEALCRRLVAVHSLYGVDKNPMAIELAKLALWLESYAEGLPLTFLDHRLVCGDSLTGPFFDQLLTYPRSGARVEGLFVQDLERRLTEQLGSALAHVRDLEASVGMDVADLERKRAAKRRLDDALAPFRLLAAAWSGGVQLGDAADDGAYERLLKAVAARDDADAVVAGSAELARMAELGAEGVAYDLVFPEVFHPGGGVASTGGFDVVLGNPPWEGIRRSDDQFFGSIDFAALAGVTKQEKKAIVERLLGDPAVSAAYRRYVEGFEEQDRLFDRVFTVHQARVKGNLAGRGTYDAYMLFAERGAVVVGTHGSVGWVLPSGFHANEGATGVRELYLEKLALRCCFSFENRHKLFEIDSRFKFATVVARNEGRPTDAFDCAFYLHDAEWLFQREGALRYTLDFVRRTGGDYLSFLELRSEADRSVASTCFSSGQTFGRAVEEAGIRLSQEVNMTYESERFTPIADVLPGGEDPREPELAARLVREGWLVLHEGKTFHQYDDRWADRPRYLVHTDALADKPAWREAARYYRLAFRDIASSTNERTGIFCVLPAPVVFGNTAPCEREPDKRPIASAFIVMALADSHSFDWNLRQKSAAHVNLFILNGCPLPELTAPTSSFLSHSALRLTCNHAGYVPLWREQLGELWREPTPPFTWRVLAGDDARWAVRAAIDAVVAQAYGLDRAQYQHVLASFSHRSYPAAPEGCLAAFDELAALGLEAFVRKHDSYHDVPLVETLPAPVIDLPAPAVGGEPPTAGRPGVERSGQAQLFALEAGPLFQKPRKKRKP